MSQGGTIGAGTGGTVTTVNGTANQITSTNPAGPIVTLSTPSTFIAPGSIEATTSVKADTNFLLPATDATHGRLLINGTSFLSFPGGVATGNTFVSGSGNLTISGIQTTGAGFAALNSAGASSACTAMGYAALFSNITGSDCSAFGANALTLCTGGGNSAFGSSAGASLTSGLSNSYFGQDSGQDSTGNFCTAVGWQSLLNDTGDNNIAIGAGALSNGVNVLSGSDNIAIGFSASSSFTSTEANNIQIGSTGVIADANTIRIGTSGSGALQQNKCFIAGIQGVTPTGTLSYVTINSSGQLGSTSELTAPAYTSINFAASPYTVLATDYYISADTVGGAITVKLPNAPTTSRVIIIKDRTGHAAANNVSITTVGGAVTIDGATTLTMTANFQSIQLLFNGTSYEVF